jgi:endonuclease/exonuclease/phosphatase family metal-dependent hydrolase
MRIASFNVENLFSRARAMNLAEWADGKDILAEFSKLNTRIQKPVYSAADKQAILDSLAKLGLSKSDESKFARLRQTRGRLVKRPRGGATEVVAAGRADWVGWLELMSEPVNEIATQMTAAVIKDVNADILAVIEAEDRTALRRFDQQLLKTINAAYDGIMLIDGNDDRGIDVGLMTKTGFTIESIVSHVDDFVDRERVFSRDCPEFTVRVNATTTILVLVNHFKSKGYGSPATSNAKRRAQAQRVHDIYDLRRSQNIDLIAIVGDLNDTPWDPTPQNPLHPLLSSDLKDISSHPQFQDGGRPGTFGNCTKSNKIDYILLSPEMFQKVTTGGIFRKGIWGGTHGTLFAHYSAMTKPVHAGSDHAAIWAELAI